MSTRAPSTCSRMQLKLLAFAQAADRLGFRERLVDASPNDSPRSLLARLAPEFDPQSARVAVDQVYHDWDRPISDAAEIALIPPVSGG